MNEIISNTIDFFGGHSQFTQQRLEEGFQNYLALAEDEPKEFVHRLEAVARTRKAWLENESSLNLNLPITSLPPGIEYLKNLSVVVLGDNVVLKSNWSVIGIGRSNFIKEIHNAFFEKVLDNYLIEKPGLERSNAIKEFKYAKLHNSKKIEFYIKTLGAIPPGFEYLSNLESFTFAQSELTRLPSEIGKLGLLKNLNLYGNNLTYLPSEIGLLTSLEFFSVSHNKLTELPKEIGNLRSLQTLDLSLNQIKRLPPEIANLTQLKSLHIDRNEIREVFPEILKLIGLETLSLRYNYIKVLPREIGNLVLLRNFDIASNSLTNIPMEIGQLTLLTSLNIYGNKLLSLPVTIGQLLQLSNLFLVNNPQLSELPMSIGHIPGLIFIDIDRTNISESSRDAILELCRAKRGDDAARILNVRLNLWIKRAESEENLVDKFALIPFNKRVDTNEWLFRLEKTKDFNYSQKPLAQIVCKILSSVIDNKEFSNIFFAQVIANNECCEDRSAMSLNEIYTSWRVICDLEGKTTKDKLAIMTGVAKTLALRDAIGNKISKYKKENGIDLSESVEIYLYYESSLREELHLESAIRHMTYTNIGKRDWIQDEELKAEVEQNFFSKLFDLPAFEKLICEDSKIEKQFDALNTEYESRIGVCPPGGELDDAVLQHKVRAGELMQELRKKKMEIANKYYNSLISSPK